MLIASQKWLSFIQNQFVNMLFQQLQSNTHQSVFGIAFVVVRILLGAQLFFAGFEKLGEWSAAGYLKGANGPFAEFFQSLAGNPLIDALNVWGLMLIGLALILGLMVRPASFFGAMLMGLYYFAHFETNTAHGYIDSHIMYIALFILFMAGGAGHAFGLNGIVARNLRKKSAISQVLFG